MTETVQYRFSLRRNTAAALAAVNEVPLVAEMVIETDQGLSDGKRKIKIGDGATHYNDLPYLAISGVSAPVVYADASGTITPDASNTSSFEFTLSANATINAPSNRKAGQILTLMFTQPALGACSVTFDGSFIVMDGSAQDTTGKSTGVFRGYVANDLRIWGAWQNRIGGGAGTWTPGELATLPAVWLNDTSAVIDDGTGHCSQWSDISGNSRHFVQTAAAQRPVITASGMNSLRALTFDGVDDWLDGTVTCKSLTNGISQFAMFAVANAQIPASGDARLLNFSIGTSLNTSGRIYIGLEHNVALALQLRLDGGGNAAIASAAYTAQAARIFGSEHDYTAQTLTMRLDGSDSPTVVNTAQGSGTTSATNSTEVALCGTASVSDQCAAATVAEVIVLGYVPVVAERQKIEGYLAWKWGIQANLPADHPYKSAAP